MCGTRVSPHGPEPFGAHLRSASGSACGADPGYNWSGSDRLRAEPISEQAFRWEINEDAMATEKLAEGIRNFHADALKLGKIIEERLGA
ncbi:hypothetical protein FHG66_11075 [Rubellimicrobium rubrum]|uniref:Transaldolase n=1 Tax=Rubellimicrobium rubrum TaxID=2585369 RepID=A0A5C4MXI2_9RHOB|nr:transaldolase family protein [Rubellimicrobium rubrum]TNC49431.1 hypothetical protein FHG66_11075 [Rubellimicrobium rubrum]